MNGKHSEWATAKAREWYNEVEQEDGDRQSIVQDTIRAKIITCSPFSLKN